jgi:hypothetical protein
MDKEQARRGRLISPRALWTRRWRFGRVYETDERVYEGDGRADDAMGRVYEGGERVYDALDAFTRVGNAFTTAMNAITRPMDVFTRWMEGVDDAYGCVVGGYSMPGWSGRASVTRPGVNLFICANPGCSPAFAGSNPGLRAFSSPSSVLSIPLRLLGPPG